MIDAVSKASQLTDLQMSPSNTVTTNKPTSAGGFEAVLKNVATDTMNALQKSELTAIAGIKGQANVQDVVNQVMAAERTLQTTIAVRDKVVAAYQEISRMAI